MVKKKNEKGRRTFVNRTLDRPNGVGGVLALGEARGGALAPPASQSQKDPIYNIPTPPDDHNLSSVECAIQRAIPNKSSRRLYGRAALGMLIPGIYYWITWSSIKTSENIEKSWFLLRRWLKRTRPLSAWIYCLTREHCGVIHMVLRLGPGEKRLEVTRVRSYWEKTHKSVQCRIEKIGKTKENLLQYFGDQRKKLAGEMMWQSMIIRWKFSQKWLPVGFTREFGRFWYRMHTANLDDITRTELLRDWLLSVREEYGKLKCIPCIEGNRVFWTDEIWLNRSN